MRVFHHNRHARGGVTLVELLVVVTILMMLAAFAIPSIRPMTEGRRVREAVRAVDVLLTRAKTRALEIQRPVGVLFERIRQVDLTGATVYQDDACNILRIVEIPPAYAGEFSNSRMRLVSQVTNGNLLVLRFQILVNDFVNGLIREGDQIQFNYQGPYFTITWDSSASNPPDFEVDSATKSFIFFKPDNTTYAADLQPVPPDQWVDTHQLTVTIPTAIATTAPPGWSIGVPFQIRRQPQPSPIAPLRLPKNTVIDLGDSGYYPVDKEYSLPVVTPRKLYPFLIYEQASGENKQFADAFARIGDEGNPALDNQGPVILFDPNGAIQYVYHWEQAQDAGEPPTYGPHRITQPVFLMIGKWERTGHQPISGPGVRVDSLADDKLHNWQDASNVWISINPQNGLVAAAEVNAQDVTPSGISVPGDPLVPHPPYPVPNDPTSATAQDQLARELYSSRAFARQAQISMGAQQE